MNTETNELLERLAQKLGTTVEYLWSVLIKQAPISSTVTLFQFALIITFGIVLYRLHIKFSKETYNKNSIYYEYQEAAAIPMIVGFLIFLLLAVCGFFCIEDMINGFINPEYWALSKILSTK